MPIYAVGIAQVPSVNTLAIRRLLRVDAGLSLVNSPQPMRMPSVPVYLQSNANSRFERHLVSAELRKHCGLHSCLGEFKPVASLYRRF